MAAQMKAFLDSTGGLWQSGGLVGKPVSMFVSAGTQGGGLETTVLPSLPVFSHHGMIYVPCGYSFGEHERVKWMCLQRMPGAVRV